MNQYDIAIPGKKYIFGLSPFSGTELLKTLEYPVLRVGKVSFVMLMSDFWKAPSSP